MSLSSIVEVESGLAYSFGLIYDINKTLWDIETVKQLKAHSL